MTFRILGVASTTRGFAFAVTESPCRLIDGGCRRTKSSTSVILAAISRILGSARPLFVAVERELKSRKRERGHLFQDALRSACRTSGIMVIDIDSSRLDRLAGKPRSTKWDIAAAAVRRCADYAHKLPPRPKPWHSEDERISVLVAFAVATVAWHSFAD
jgi:hypothetical protein